MRSLLLHIKVKVKSGTESKHDNPVKSGCICLAIIALEIEEHYLIKISKPESFHFIFFVSVRGRPHLVGVVFSGQLRPKSGERDKTIAGSLLRLRGGLLCEVFKLIVVIMFGERSLVRLERVVTETLTHWSVDIAGEHHMWS